MSHRLYPNPRVRHSNIPDTATNIYIITVQIHQNLLISGFLKVCNQVPPVLLLPQACIDHLSPWDVLLGLLEVDVQRVLPPGDPLLLVGPGVAVPLCLFVFLPNNPLKFGPCLCFPPFSTVRNVMLVYIRVSVVLSWQYCRKESQKLDITLDSAVFVFRVKEIQSTHIFSKFIQINWDYLECLNALPSG